MRFPTCSTCGHEVGVIRDGLDWKPATCLVCAARDAQPAGAELLTCPRRMGEHGPWPAVELLDFWKLDTWLADPEAARERADKAREVVTALRSGAPSFRRPANVFAWLGSGDPPATCSFCKSIRPADAIRLAGCGWEAIRSGERVVHLCPPGTGAKRAALRRALASMGDPGGDPNFATVPSVWTPDPPLAVHAYHFTAEEIGAFNEALLR